MKIDILDGPKSEMGWEKTLQTCDGNGLRVLLGEESHQRKTTHPS